jgi:hypothetical protein
MALGERNNVDVEIDQLTDSIVNAYSGDRFDTEIVSVSVEDLRLTTRKNGWRFDWKKEHTTPKRKVYKLYIENNPSIIQGLVCLEVMADHIHMHLLESAPFNIGIAKTYLGVPGNLVAFACHLSLELGFEGNLAFVAKSQLIKHYQDSLGAVFVGGQRMIIFPDAALKLIQKYFK